MNEFINEVWREIPGLDRYEVSDQGRVRINPPDETRRYVRRGVVTEVKINRKVRMVKATERRGSYYFTAGGKQWHSVREVVGNVFLGIPPSGKKVAPINGIMSDNRASNLHHVEMKATVVEQQNQKRQERQVFRKRVLVEMGTMSDTLLTEKYGLGANTISLVRTTELWSEEKNALGWDRAQSVYTRIPMKKRKEILTDMSTLGVMGASKKHGVSEVYLHKVRRTPTLWKDEKKEIDWKSAGSAKRLQSTTIQSLVQHP